MCTRRVALSGSTSVLALIGEAHHGHSVNGTGEIDDRPVGLAHPRSASTNDSASSNRFGVTEPPTHSPIRNGSTPHGFDPAAMSRRRSTSAAATSVAARCSCCEVSSRSV